MAWAIKTVKVAQNTANSIFLIKLKFRIYEYIKFFYLFNYSLTQPTQISFHHCWDYHYLEIVYVVFTHD